MRVVEQTSDRLVLHQSAWGFRGMGAFIGALGSGVVALSWQGRRGVESGAAIGYVVGGAFALVGIGVLLTAADLRVVFDRFAKTARLVRRTLWRATTTEFPFSSIRDIALEESVMSSGNSRAQPAYRVVFILRDGSRAPWTTVSTGDVGSQSTCVAAARAFGGWGGNERPGGHAAAADAASTARDPLARPTPVGNLRLAAGVLGLFALVGLAMTLVQAERLLVWRPTPARVLSAHVESVRGSKGSISYRPVVSYQYGVNGREYQSRAVSVLSESRSYGWATSITDRFPPGATVTAYVDPTDPAHAYLLHRMSVLPLAFLAAPLLMGGLLYGVVRWSARQAADADTANVPLVPAPSVADPAPLR